MSLDCKHDGKIEKTTFYKFCGKCGLEFKRNIVYEESYVDQFRCSNRRGYSTKNKKPRKLTKKQQAEEERMKNTFEKLIHETILKVLKEKGEEKELERYLSDTSQIREEIQRKRIRESIKEYILEAQTTIIRFKINVDKYIGYWEKMKCDQKQPWGRYLTKKQEEAKKKKKE